MPRKARPGFNILPMSICRALGHSQEKRTQDGHAKRCRRDGAMVSTAYPCACGVRRMVWKNRERKCVMRLSLQYIMI